MLRFAVWSYTAILNFVSLIIGVLNDTKRNEEHNHNVSVYKNFDFII